MLTKRRPSAILALSVKNYRVLVERCNALAMTHTGEAQAIMKGGFHAAQSINQAVFEYLASVFKRALDLFTHSRDTYIEAEFYEISETIDPRAAPFVGRGVA